MTVMRLTISRTYIEHIWSYTSLWTVILAVPGNKLSMPEYSSILNIMEKTAGLGNRKS